MLGKICDCGRNQPAPQQCHGCFRNYCADCVVEILGSTGCGPCRDRKVDRLERGGAPTVPRRLFWAGGTLIGIGFVGFAFGLGGMVTGTLLYGLSLFVLSAFMAWVGVMTNRSLHRESTRLRELDAFEGRPRPTDLVSASSSPPPL